MSAGTADAAAAQVAPWIERLARAGFAAKAVLYATVGILAARLALGNGGRTTDTRGAMHSVDAAPFGGVLIAVVAVGLLGYAVWRVVEGIADPERRGTGAQALVLRGSFVIRGLMHGALAITALRLTFGSPSEGDGNDVERWTGRALEVTGGRSLLWAVAISVGGFGLYQLYRGLTAKLGDELALGEISADVGRWIIGVSRAGIAARGVVFMMIAVLLGNAALRRSPSRAGGIEDALQSLTALGKWPFLAIAAGLVAYGVYEMLNARYRRIRVR